MTRAISTVSARSRILVVDDHPVVREGLRMFLGTRADFEIVGEAATGDEAIKLAGTCGPDVVLLDLDLGHEGGLDVMPQLLAPGRRILVVTASRDLNLHQQALVRGARGVVLKDKVRDVLLKAIDKVQAGELWFERSVLARQIDQAAAGEPPDSEAGRIASLTAREREIIALIGRGLKNQDIGDALFISEKTVRNHITGIFSKLGVADRFEAAMFAYRHGLARIPL